MSTFANETSYSQILVVICNPMLDAEVNAPTSLSPIDFWRECSRIRNVLKDIKNPRITFCFNIVRPPTLSQLHKLLTAPPNGIPISVVHFIGHVVDGLLYMEDHCGKLRKVNPETLSQCFVGFNVDLVMLNTCHGTSFAQALREKAKVVMTSNDEIEDPEADLYAREIYSRLAAGESTSEAFQHARKLLVEAYNDRQLRPSRGNVIPIERYGQMRSGLLHYEGMPDHFLQQTSKRYPLGVQLFNRNEPPNNLPPLNGNFIGRGDILAEICQLMEDGKARVLALTGIGGIGKTWLATVAAVRNSWRYHAVISFQCDPASRDILSDLYERFLSVVAKPTTNRLPTQSVMAALTSELNEGCFLLVLHDVDALRADQAVEIRGLIDMIDGRMGTRVLLTVRSQTSPLFHQLHNHVILPVSPLPMLDAVSLLYDALFIAENSLELPQSQILDKVPRLASQLAPCSVREDIPLDIVSSLTALATSACFHPFLLWSAAEMLRDPENNWEEVIERLRRLDGDLLEKADEWVGNLYKELMQHTPEGIEVLNTVRAFRGGASQEALKHVWSEAYGNAVDADLRFARGCSRARAYSLLRLIAGRYDIDPLVRQYLDRVTPKSSTDLTTCLRKAHQTWFMHYARSAAIELRETADKSILDRLETEFDNFSQAIQLAKETGDINTGLKIASSLGALFELRGRAAEGMRLLQPFLSQIRQDSDQTAAHAYHTAAVLSWRLTDYKVTRRYLRQSLRLWCKIYRKLSSQADILPDNPELTEATRAIASGHNILGVWGQFSGQLSGARQVTYCLLHYKGSLKMLDAHPDKVLRLSVLSNRCLILVQHVASKQAATEAVRQFEQILSEVEDDAAKSGCLIGKGYGHFLLHEHRNARICFEEALRISVEQGHLSRSVSARLNLSMLECAMGNLDIAKKHYSETFEQAINLQETRFEIYCYEGLMEVCQGEGRSHDAVVLFGYATAMRERITLERSLADHSRYKEHLHNLQSQCGIDVYESYIQEGKMLNEEEARNFARNVLGR